MVVMVMFIWSFVCVPFMFYGIDLLSTNVLTVEDQSTQKFLFLNRFITGQ